MSMTISLVGGMANGPRILVNTPASSYGKADQVGALREDMLQRMDHGPQCEENWLLMPCMQIFCSIALSAAPLLPLSILGLGSMELLVTLRLNPWKTIASLCRPLGVGCFSIPADGILALVPTRVLP